MKVHVRTYGCQMNERDSDAAGVLLEGSGCELTTLEEEADVILVNTCSVRAKAEDKALGKLRLLVHSKREREHLVVGAIGCMVERLGARIFHEVEGLDFAVGTHRLHKLPEILKSAASSGSPMVDVGLNEDLEALSGHTPGAVTSYVAIMRGCNRGCSYCIVPAVRGREHSRSTAAVVKEVETLVANGVMDVTLLGQSVTSYGLRNHDESGGQESESPLGFREPLPILLETVSGVDGLARVRFTSSHPSGCTNELARAIGELSPVCEHLHLPIQSGADRVLGLMRRGYCVDDYRVAVKRLRSAVPGLALTTDVIVGYPSETAEEFEMTREVMQEIGFDNAFIFKYSPRPDTRAGQQSDDVSDEEKIRRNRVLLEDQNERGQIINDRLIDQRVEVLVEGVSPRDSSKWHGRTRTNKIVILDPDPGVKRGDLADVRVSRAMPQTLRGALVTRE